MAARGVLPALTAAAALVLTGCGSAEKADPAAASPESPAVSVAPTPTAAEPGVRTTAPRPVPPVAPEVVVPTTTDPVSQAKLGGWQGVTLAGLKEIDARLVSNEQATIARVRSACDAFSIGLFQAKAVALVRKKFSTATMKLTQNQAEMAYQVILRDACYVMSGT